MYFCPLLYGIYFGTWFQGIGVEVWGEWSKDREKPIGGRSINWYPTFCDLAGTLSPRNSVKYTPELSPCRLENAGVYSSASVLHQDAPWVFSYSMFAPMLMTRKFSTPSLPSLQQSPRAESKRWEVQLTCSIVELHLQEAALCSMSWNKR